MDQLPIVQLPMLMFTAGVHPHDAKSCNDRTVGFLESLASDSRCVAIGECGGALSVSFRLAAVPKIWLTPYPRPGLRSDVLTTGCPTALVPEANRIGHEAGHALIPA